MDQISTIKAKAAELTIRGEQDLMEGMQAATD
jgi:hypothetical protein